ncbi:MAG TPA: hypothetical protein VKM37_03285 [Balneolaceae bacterium]|nr:hypothetical protein [Balneolaceae bacterium]
MKKKPSELYQKAEDELKRAQGELYRPAEDVVSYSACLFSRKALTNYLQALSLLYAEKNNAGIDGMSTIEDWIGFSRQYSDDLKDVDFSSLNCKCNEILEDESEQIVFCTSVDKVHHCSELAEKVRDILVKEFPSAF